MDFEPTLWLSCNKLSQQRPYSPKDTPLSNNSEAAPAVSKSDRAQGSELLPKFDDRGLLTAVVTDSVSNEVLMVGFMNAEALAMTRESGRAHFWSRSRQKLWMKGETSGNVLEVEEILVDCDQDAFILKARPAGPTCHTGAPTCFYRKLQGNALVKVKT